jgi:hypothetical protein
MLDLEGIKSAPNFIHIRPAVLEMNHAVKHMDGQTDTISPIRAYRAKDA